MYKLFLATPEGVVLEDMVHSVTVPGSEGFFQVLTNHAAIMSSLQAGNVVIIDKDQRKKIWKISGGYFAMSHNEATLLADSIC